MGSSANAMVSPEEKQALVVISNLSFPKMTDLITKLTDLITKLTEVLAKLQREANN